VDSNQYWCLGVQHSLYENRKFFAAEQAFESDNPKQAKFSRQIRLCQQFNPRALSIRLIAGHRYPAPNGTDHPKCIDRFVKKQRTKLGRKPTEGSLIFPGCRCYIHPTEGEL